MDFETNKHFVITLMRFYLLYIFHENGNDSFDFLVN